LRNFFFTHHTDDPTVYFAEAVALLSCCFVFPNATITNSVLAADDYSLEGEKPPFHIIAILTLLAPRHARLAFQALFCAR
jgi:hypothetical protein